MDFFCGPAMQRYEIACRFWISGHTSREIALSLGIKQKAVEYQLARIRRVMRNPFQPIKVMRRVTKDGKPREGVTAPYSRHSIVQAPGSHDMVKV